MIRYFEKDLKSSIKAEIDQDATHLDDYKELVTKIVRAEAKAGLQPSSYVRKTDIQVLQRSRPAYTTMHKVQIQEMIHCEENSKASKAPASTPESEPSNKAKKDKKKKQHKDRKESRDSITLVNGVNTAKVGVKKRRKKKKKDASEITCYKCNKLGHCRD